MRFAASVLLLFAGVLAATEGKAIDAATESAERERIRAERAQAEQVFAARERECRDRFAVTRCLDEARRERRATLEHLNRQQGVLDEAQRKQRAAQRMESIRGKVSTDEAKRREADARARRKTERGSAAAASAP